MRRIRYAVAMSLDGYIAGPNGEFDWIITDPDIDFGEIYSRFDTVLLGRRTFEAMGHGGSGSMPGMKMIVFSRTMRQEDFPRLTIVAEGLEDAVASLRSGPGKDLWLFGGGSLFRSFLEARLVDTVEVAVVPVLLAQGIPLLPPPAEQVKLRLTSSKAFKTGIMSLEYAVEYAPTKTVAKKDTGRRRNAKGDSKLGK
jgi:dihydrofolate reductase